ncbi:hypothetical protein SK128_021853 [Halocaridina rubra]|uniref:C-type lectin domain-containing protein n=1 Tax=Halocaridina rubra TaxID=373956 RepID=A0AAN8XME7_HALRR
MLLQHLNNCRDTDYGIAIKNPMLCAESKEKDSCQIDSESSLVFKDDKGSYDQLLFYIPEGSNSYSGYSNWENTQSKYFPTMNKLAIIIGAILIVGANGQSCPDGWVAIGGICYRFHQEVSMPWDDARTFCEDEGAFLAKITDSDVHRAFYEYILTYSLSGSFWLGGTDELYEGDWHWVVDDTRIDRGTPLWALSSGILGWSHEPSGGPDENCLGLDKDRKYYFNDLNCNNVHHPVCMMI